MWQQTAQGLLTLWANVLLQGDPNQSLLIQMAITMKIRISDPKLVKPKCVSEACIYFHFSAICLQFSAVCLQFQKIKCRPTKHILALPTWGQKCIFTLLQPFELANFDLGHPVHVWSRAQLQGRQEGTCRPNILRLFELWLDLNLWSIAIICNHTMIPTFMKSNSKSFVKKCIQPECRSYTLEILVCLN